jgi:hypothetical protein
MDFKALKRLSEESPFKGERDNAKEKLRILRKKPLHNLSLDKPVIYFNRLFRKYRNQWFYVKYELEKHGFFEVKFVFLGFFRHGKKKEFSFAIKRFKYFDKEKEKWVNFGEIKQTGANNVVEVRVNKSGQFNDMKEFLTMVGFSYNKKLPLTDDVSPNLP